MTLREAVRVRIKACFAGNGMAIVKKHNAESRPHSLSRRAAAQPFLDCVAVLGKGMPFPADRALPKTIVLRLSVI